MLYPGSRKYVEKLERVQEHGKLPLSGRERQAPAYLVYGRRGEDVTPSQSARPSVRKGVLAIKNM